MLAVAEPTAADRAAGEKNVQANLVLLGTDESRKLSLLELKSPNGSFGRIVPVRGKGDYPTLSAALATESDAPA